MGYSPWGHKRVRHDLVSKQQQQQLHAFAGQVSGVEERTDVKVGQSCCPFFSTPGCLYELLQAA